MGTTGSLASGRCVPCEGGVPALDDERIAAYLDELGGGWTLSGGRLAIELRFPDFRTALDYTNLVGELAEREGHHPDILLGWGKVRILLWTHAASGLTENDFVLAAKISQIEV